jgi:pyruvate dehydrogenase E2 component (dihydrolipoamide acetyltransferase)
VIPQNENPNMVDAMCESTPQPLKIKDEVVLTGKKTVVGNKVLKSYLSAPHIYLNTLINMSTVLHFLADIRKSKNSYRVTITDIILKSVASVLLDHPLLNASLDDKKIVIFESINIGIAVAADKGLVVPVLTEVDKLPIDKIAFLRGELVDKARREKLTLMDLSNGTFTVTNLGMYDVISFDPILYPGQSGILAVGKIIQTPVGSFNGTVELKPIMNCTLACDHRIVDGVDGAEFLTSLKRYIEDPDLSEKLQNCKIDLIK